MRKVRIGIDPGKNGAIVIFDSAGDSELTSYCKIFVMPTIGKELDIVELTNILAGYIEDEDNDIHCVIEDVHAIFGASAKATFEFGYVCGVLEGILGSFAIPYTKVAPKKWQAEMWEGIKEVRKPAKLDKNGKEKKGSIDTKAMSLLAAKKLFPRVRLTDPKSIRATKPHDGIVDALLIADYCDRKF